MLLSSVNRLVLVLVLAVQCVLYKVVPEFLAFFPLYKLKGSILLSLCVCVYLILL
jgi:hypothetical protein